MSTEITFYLYTVLCLSVLSESAVSVCPSAHYFNLTDYTCKPCSRCPINQIIRWPCSKDRDTICGPFKEFSQFHLAPRNSTSHRHPKNNGQFDKEKSISPHDGTTPDSSRGTVVDLTSVSSGEREWRTLAIALIGVLCVVSISLISFVFLFCYFRHKRQIVEKQVFFDPAIDSNNSYMQVKTHVSSRDRLKNNIRVLRELRHQDYDSGSDDSAQNTPEQSSRLITRQLPLVLGPILVEDYDADNSGQTVSTTKSSDYVYFNRPRAANGVLPEPV